MKRADEIIPWKLTDISLKPYKGMWSFNPSIHFDGLVWRCTLRCSDYAMPGGVQIRSDRARQGESRTKNAMVIFDPQRWRPAQIYKMHERDDLPRVPCNSVGYEDIRIFRTDRGGLQGIAASLHLKRDDRRGPRHPLAEQVLLTLDDRYDIVAAHPIRGSWSVEHQKNWVPFDHCAEPRFLYDINEGTLFDARGAVRSETAFVAPSTRTRRRSAELDERLSGRASERAKEVEQARQREHERDRDQRRRVWRGRPVDPPRGYDGLRGGTQLVRVSNDAWLGIGHAVKIVDDLKYYWHVWYLVDARGKMRSASPPMKLAPNGIEFAAGMAIDGERIVVSFGVDDMECWIGETKLSAVMETLQVIAQ